MGWTARIERVVPDLAATLLRFPVAVLVAIAMCGYFNFEAGASWGDEAQRMWLAGWAAFMASGAAHLFAEARRFSRPVNLACALAAALAAGAIGWFAREAGAAWYFLLAGLALVLMVSGFLARGKTQGALWWFNARLILGFIIAGLVAVVFGAGLSAILASLDYLFGVAIPDRSYEHLWLTAATLVAPLYGLSLVPRDMESERPEAMNLLDRGATVLVNYLLVPMALVYALILHAYAAKIALGGELPNNQIGWMVLLFALGGTATWLIAWPWRETGSRLSRLFIKGWFWLTLVPVVLLALALWERITNYGVTPDRYGLAVVALWFALIGLYLAWRRNRADMRFIIGSLGVLLVLSSFGPWGANSVSVASQFARLEKMLTDNGVLKDGRIAEPAVALPQALNSEANSIVWMLSETYSLDLMKPWFEGVKDNPFVAGDDRWSTSSKISNFLGFNEYHMAADAVSFSYGAPGAMALEGAAQLYGPIRIFNQCEEAMKMDYSACVENGALTIKLQDRRISVATLPLLEAAKAASPANAAAGKPFVFAVEGGRMIVTNLWGELGKAPKINGGEFFVAGK